MEIEDDILFGSPDFYIKSAQKFELEVKKCLKWKREQWIRSGQSNSRLKKLCSSLFYWKAKLKPAVEKVSLIFTLFNSEKNVRINLFDIINSIESLDPKFIVKGCANFRNPRYLCLYFDTEEIRDNVKEKFRFIENNYVVYLTWALEGQEAVKELKVHWLPMTMNIEIIKNELNKYVECIETERLNFTSMSGRNMPAGKIAFKVLLKKDVTAESIPHVTMIGNMESLITVSGRKPLCLNCEVLGHISKDCKSRFCSVCRELKPLVHECAEKSNFCSYAEKLKGEEEDYREIAPDDWGAQIVTRSSITNKVELHNIAEKISVLQNEIKKVDTEDAQKIKVRLEKKRKVGEANPEKEEKEIRFLSPSSSDEESNEMDVVKGGNLGHSSKVNSASSLISLKETPLFKPNNKKKRNSTRVNIEKVDVKNRF